MALLFPIAEALGTDPISLIVLGALSIACAFYMKALTGNSILAVLSFPVLLAGGLLADDAALALGLYAPLPPGSMAASEGLPNVLLAGITGMTVSGLALMAAFRSFQ